MGIGEYFLKVVGEILVLTIVMVAGAFCIRLLLRRTQYIEKVKVMLAVGLLLYLCLVAYVTIFSRDSTSDMLVEFRVFRGLVNSLELTGKFIKSCYHLVLDKVWLPLERPDINIVHIREGALNFLLFVPFGYLLPTVLSCKKNGTIWRITLIGFLMIMLIELTQLFVRIGSFDLDDLINNTLGVSMGVGMYVKYIALDSSGSEGDYKRS